MIDLNKLREQLSKSQQRGTERPTDVRDKIFVNPTGQIVQGTDAQPGQVLSEVRQDIFSGRLDDDRRAVRTHLPPNATERRTREGHVGFQYEFTCAFGMAYEMFAYFDGANYQVMVLHPEIEREWQSPHTGHIYPDGRICFGVRYGSGQPTLQEAYAKSVLWAAGISAARLGRTPFPFPINNR